jgi:hypothetical protein
MDDEGSSGALSSQSAKGPGGPEPTDTIVDVASSNADFEILTQAVIFAGLAEELDGRRQSTAFALSRFVRGRSSLLRPSCLR